MAEAPLADSLTGDGDTDDAVVELEAFDDVDENDFDELLDVDLEDEVGRTRNG